jgi:hypothetical protein
MARDASEALGARQLAGAVVMPKGHAWQHLRVPASRNGAARDGTPVRCDQ